MKIVLENIKVVYFLGIGGIGMSALARWFQANQFQVMGYDKTSTDLTKELEKEGFQITYEDSKETLPTILEEEKEHCLIVYTPAIPKNSIQLNFFQEEKYLLQKRSQVLGLLTANYFTIAVAGTHGKTTTSSLIAHILRYAKKNSMSFLGGITQNYQTNLLLNDVDSTEEPIVVVEADEYDRSFLTLSPNITIITSTDPDHLDIYDNPEIFEQGFSDFVDKIDEKGTLIYHEDISTSIAQKRGNLAKIIYGINEEIGTHGKNIQVIKGKQQFDYVGQGVEIKNIKLQVPGFHNIANTIAGITACLLVGLSPEIVKDAVEDFKGVRRRFEYLVESEEKIYIDDYAHHPSEISSFLKSVKNLYPTKKITAIFQPHLFSRTRDFMDGFAESLALADELLLMEIYPARELPIEGITSQVLFDKIDMNHKELLTKEVILEKICDIKNEVVVTIGAGNIDTLRNSIKEQLINAYTTN